MIGDAAKGREEQEAILINYLSYTERLRYVEALHSEKLGKDGATEYELASLMRAAMHAHHKVNFPRSPLCQWQLELLSLPFEHWLFNAAQLGHIEAKYEYLLQIESSASWDKIRDGFTELIEKHHHIDSYERLAFLYSFDGLMNAPQIAPELDYEKANVLLKSAVELGAEWLYRKILWNYDALIKCGKATTTDKQLFIKQSKTQLKHESIELPKKYKKAIRPICRKLKYKNVDFVNSEEIVDGIRYDDRKLFRKKTSKKSLLQEEAANYIESCMENKKREILI